MRESSGGSGRERPEVWRSAWDELAEALVVVVGVVPALGVARIRPARDDAALPAMVEPGRLNGVLPVIAAVLGGQEPLAVAEGDAVVARVLERPARPDVLDHL